MGARHSSGAHEMRHWSWSPALPTVGDETGPMCHPERSEGSFAALPKIPRFARDDTVGAGRLVLFLVSGALR
jgi:hypothetical protein